MLCVSVCVPFAPLSHDSCCTSSGFCFVWSVCGLASHTVNAVFFTIASKPPLLTVWVGTVSLHTCTVLVCCVLPPLAFLLIRTVTSPWLRKSCLLCVFVIQCQHPVLVSQPEDKDMFSHGLELSGTVCIYSPHEQNKSQIIVMVLLSTQPSIPQNFIHDGQLHTSRHTFTARVQYECFHYVAR